LWELFTVTALVASPLRHPTTGWPSDLACLTARDARNFHRTYYVPQNAVATIVGDVDPAKVIQLAEAYFGDIPRGAPPPPLITREPEQNGEKRVRLEAAVRPYLIMGYKKPSAPHPDDTVLAVTASILSSGRASRLYRHLVLQRHLARDIDVTFDYPGERGGTNLFVVSASPLEPDSLRELEQAIVAELDSLKATPVREEELRRIRSSMEAAYIFRQESNLGLALSLSYYESLYGDWREAFRRPDKLRSVTARDVMRVAEQYFVPSNLTVAYIGEMSDEDSR